MARVTLLLAGLCTLFLLTQGNHHERGARRRRLARSDLAAPGQFPWQAAIVMDGKFFCGGSLISDAWLLTAAYCTDGFSTFVVTLGSNTIMPPQDGSMNLVSRTSLVHPDYNALGIGGNVGLIRLPKRVKFSDAVRPVRLPRPYLDHYTFEDMILVTCGWGAPEKGTVVLSPNLRYVELRGMSTPVCNRTVNGSLTNRHLCVRGDTAVLAMKGDGGSAVTFREVDQIDTQVGIVAYSHQYHTDILISTLVSAYRPWILEQMAHLS